jgi:hypothetical protein
VASAAAVVLRSARAVGAVEVRYLPHRVLEAERQATYETDTKVKGKTSIEGIARSGTQKTV